MLAVPNLLDSSNFSAGAICLLAIITAGCGANWSSTVEDSEAGLRAHMAPEMTSVGTQEIPYRDAEERLKRLFYDFMEIDWRPPKEAIALAQQEGKPIFAVVLWGSLDDQSC